MEFDCGDGKQEEGWLVAAAGQGVGPTAALPSLTNLPDALLWDITRRAGPRARLLCRTLRDLHPPPTAFRIATRALPLATLHHLLAHPRAPQPSITSLSLPPTAPQATTAPKPPSKPSRPSAGPTLSAAVTHFPTLQSLSYSTPTPPTQDDLQALTPLATHLTALRIHPTNPTAPPCPCTPDPTPLTPLQSLPSLRSLALPCGLPHTTRLPPYLAPLATLPHLMNLTLTLPPTAHIPGALLPALAAAAPRLTSLRLLHAPLAWDPPSVAALHRSFPHLAHFHLHLGITPSPNLWLIPTRPPPPAAGPHPPIPTGPWPALGAALRHRTDSGLTLTAELNLAAPSWAPLLPHLSPTQLTLRLTPTDLHNNPTLAAALWPWLAAQRGLRRLTIDSPALPLSHPLTSPPPTLPLSTTLANALSITHLSLHLPWLPAAACPALLPALRPLTRLTHLHLSGPPSAPWPPHATAPLTTLTALAHLSVSSGGLPRSVLPHLPHLHNLHTLALSDSPPNPPPTTPSHHAHHADPPPAPPTPPSDPNAPPFAPITNEDLALLIPLRSQLTSLTLQGFDQVNAAGLATLHAMTGLERLQLVNMPCTDNAGEEWLRAGLLPLPPALRSCLVDGPIALTLEAREALRVAARRQGCRVRVDRAVVGGVQWPLDTAVVLPEEEEQQYKVQYREGVARREREAGQQRRRQREGLGMQGRQGHEEGLGEAKGAEGVLVTEPKWQEPLAGAAAPRAAGRV